MLEINQFPKAYVEVDEILKQLPYDEFKRIESDFVNMIRNKKDTNYIFKLDSSKTLEEQKILKETKAILAYVFMNYLGTEEEVKKIRKKFREESLRIEEEKKKIYQINVFDNKKIEDKILNKLIIYKKESTIKKFFKHIINIFK